MHNYLDKEWLPGMLSVAEAAERYRVHPATIRRWIDRGLVPAYRVGERRIGIKETDLVKAVSPRPKKARRQADDTGRAIPPQITPEDQERAREIVRRTRERRAQLAAKYGPVVPPSWVLINEARDRRSHELEGKHEE